MAVAFVADPRGSWRVERQQTIIGDPLAESTGIAVLEGSPGAGPVTLPAATVSQAWRLTGMISHLRYTSGTERTRLSARSAPLGRAGARHAALIPIRKSPAWWALPQDERRAIYEERSRHTSIGLEYLPQIARRLHHSRDLGEPFDFLTWFEFAPEHCGAFDELVGRLRASEEWQYVDREIDIRLTQRDEST
jgi:chlorite dismutase